MKYPYIRINCTVDTEAIENDVQQLKEILTRLSAALNKELILIIDNDIFRIKNDDNE